ncbi:MAG: protein kinase [Myxococcota bacterium]|nr:protein kinase [Myxococcota bacterium]
MNPRLPEVGELVAAKYRLISKIGEGGYGIVYRAHQEMMGRDVAIKMLRPEASRLPDEVERFRREVFNASSLRHPNTITLYDYGQLPTGSFYIVMEFLEGMNLGHWLQKHGPVEHDKALDIVEQILRSLREAHVQSILHRDLKPENIYMTDLEGDDLLMVKVLDFGLSKAIGGRRAGQRTLTKDGQVHGTPNYMSPEQACAMKLSPASDIYSIGLLAWELLTGKTAFVGSTPVDVLLKQVNEPTPELPSPLRGTLLDEFIRRATKKDQSLRFQDGAAALEWIAQQRERERQAEMQRTLDAAKRPAPVLQASDPPTGGDRSGDRVTGSEPWFSFKDPAEIDVAELEMRLAQLPMVGRQQELHELLRWGQQALMTGGILWITGELGVGKSRLADEWLRHMEMNSVTILRGRFREDSAPMEGLRQALSPLFDESKRQSLHLPHNTLQEDLVKDLKGVMEPTQETQESRQQRSGQDWALATIEHTLYALAKRRPTVMLLEDLHWADSFSLRLVERWKEEMATRAIPLVLVFTQRSEKAHASHRPTHMNTRAIRAFNYAYDLHLERLADEESEALLDDLLPFEHELRARVVQTARGNPLYLTQIVRYLIEEELLELHQESARWGISEEHREKLGHELLPPDLRALLMQRVKVQLSQHRLSAVLDQLLVRGMLLGNRFELRLLKEMLKVEGRGDLEAYLDDALEAFTQSGVLIPTVLDGRSGLEFGYEMLRSSLLDEQPHEEISRLHVLAANAKKTYYEQRDPAQLDLYAHELAHHWSEAGDVERAFAWLMRAARAAERAQDFRQALDYLRQAGQRLSPELDPNGEHLLEIRLSEGRMFRFLGEFAPAEDALREAIEETRRVGDTVGEALTGEALAGVLTLVTRYEEAIDIYDRIQQLYEQFGEEAGVLRCQLGLGEIAGFCGDYPLCEQMFRDIEAQATALGDQSLQARCTFGLAQCAYAKGDLEDAIDAFRRARKRAESLEDAMLCSEADIEIATCIIANGHVENALSTARMALEVKQSIGDTLGQAHAHLILSMCLRRTHRIERAKQHVVRARTLNERLGHVYGIAKAVLVQAEIAWVSGEIELSFEPLRDSHKLHTEIGDAHGLLMTLLHEGLCRAEIGEADASRACLAEALPLMEENGLEHYRAKYMLVEGLIAELEGRLEDAVAFHDEALKLGEDNGHLDMMSMATISLCKAHILMGDFHAASREAPLALERAEATGHTHGLMFALTLRALLARLDRQAEVLSSTLRRLRVLNENASALNHMRIPNRLVWLCRQLRERVSDERAFPVVLSAVEIIRALGDAETADKLARQVLKPRG